MVELMTSKGDPVTAFRTGAFKRRIAWVFALQLAVADYMRDGLTTSRRWRR
jgi:hypothetical protein